jgi:hypothetical protein
MGACTTPRHSNEIGFAIARHVPTPCNSPISLLTLSRERPFAFSNAKSAVSAFGKSKAASVALPLSFRKIKIEQVAVPGFLVLSY